MRRTSPIYAIIAMLAVMPLVTSAQQRMPPLPATPVPGKAPVGVLAQYDIPELPSPHTEVWFIRLELEAAGSVAMGKQAGPAIVYVESGDVTLDANGAGNPGANTATPVAASSTVLATGSSTLIEPGTDIGFRNQGDSPTSFLMLLMFAAEMEGIYQEPQPEPIGLRQGGVAIGTAEFAPFPAHVMIERIVLNHGETITPELRARDREFPGYQGMELGAIETGSADLILDFASPANLTWPGMLRGEMTGPVMVPLSTSLQIGTGDAYAFYGSTLTWTAADGEPLTILRVIILPEVPGE